MTDTAPRVYLPEGFDAEPTNAFGALRAGKALLSEEGRWARFIYFAADLNHQDHRQQPYCGNWKACAVGALQLVTFGVMWREGYEQWASIADNRTGDILSRYANLGRDWGDLFQRAAIYEEALCHLNNAADACGATAPSAINLNDSHATGLEDVLDMYDVAMTAAVRSE